MEFTKKEHVDCSVGILVDAAFDKDFGVSKKDREKAGQTELVRQLLPGSDARWDYAESGKPFFTNRDENLSFTHSENVYACQISDRISCGIDVQHYREKIFRVAEKFLNATELRFVETVAQEHKLKTLTAMWSCKEALYKMYGKGFIDYLNLFTIHPFEPVSGIVRATADFGDGNKLYHLRVEFTDTFVLAFHTISITE